MDRPQREDLALQAPAVLGRRNPDVDEGRGFGGNHARLQAAFDFAHVDRYAAVTIVEREQALDQEVTK